MTTRILALDMKPGWPAALLALLVLGGALRTVQYASRVSLWHDELAIARNIESRDIRDLIARPLDHRQVAPVGFLVGVKVATRILGVNELGLRFTPWLAGMLALPLFWRVAARFGSGRPLLAGVAIFAASPALVWYSGSVKQYGIDLAVSLLLVWFALRILEGPRRLRDIAAASVGGGVAVVFSHPAVVTAFVLGCVLAAWAATGPWRARGPAVAAIAVGWGTGALIAAASAMAILDPDTARFMEGFWREGFPPAWSHPLALLVWLPRQLFSVFAHFLIFFTPLPLVLLLVVPLVLVAAIGLPVLARLYPWQTVIVSAPMVAGVAAAVAGLLPFRHRLALHAAWPILVFAVVGLQRIENRLRVQWPALAPVAPAVAAAPLVLVVLLAARPPYDSGQESRPIVAELARRWKPGDRLYVYCGGRHAVSFYGPRHGLSEWTANDCNNGDPRAYLREVDAFRGRPRVWFFSMLFPDDDATIVRAYLRTIGTEDETIVGESVAGRGGRIIDVYRYDLSDPARLAVVTAAEFDWPSARAAAR